VSSVLAIDPGTKVFGVAYFYNGVLARAYLADATNLRVALSRLPRCSEIVLEQMQVYIGKTVAKSIIQVAQTAGMIAGAMVYANDAKVTWYEPRVWKGGVPKEVHHPRILKILSDGERSVIEYPRSKKTSKDVLDAVGIGLYYVVATKQRSRTP
jgi:hypothetical protein